MRSEQRPLEHLSYLRSTFGASSPSTFNSRYGSRAKSYARQNSHNSVEVRGGKPRKSADHRSLRKRIEFWEEKEQAGFLEWRPSDSVFPSKSKRLPEHLEDLITSATLLAIWSDLEHDVLIPSIFGDARKREDLCRLRSRMAFHDYAVPHGSDRQQAREQARQKAHSILSKLKVDQEQRYLHELSVAASYFSAPFAGPSNQGSDTSSQHSLLVAQQQLIGFIRTHDASQNTFITHRVERNFATGMLALTRIGAHSSLHVRDSAEHLPRDIRGFTRGIHLWLLDEVTKSSRNVFKELKSRISAEEVIDTGNPYPEMGQEALPDESLGIERRISMEDASHPEISEDVLLDEFLGIKRKTSMEKDVLLPETDPVLPNEDAILQSQAAVDVLPSTFGQDVLPNENIGVDEHTNQNNSHAQKGQAASPKDGMETELQSYLVW